MRVATLALPLSLCCHAVRKQLLTILPSELCAGSEFLFKSLSMSIDVGMMKAATLVIPWGWGGEAELFIPDDNNRMLKPCDYLSTSESTSVMEGKTVGSLKNSQFLLLLLNMDIHSRYIMKCLNLWIWIDHADNVIAINVLADPI